MANKEKRLHMAYALGAIDKVEPGKNHVTYELKDTGIPEWEKYQLIGYNENENKNDIISLWYCGPYGVENGNMSVIMMFHWGMELNDIITILINMIDIHQAEIQRNTD